jgi:hypothetical protein
MVAERNRRDVNKLVATVRAMMRVALLCVAFALLAARPAAAAPYLPPPGKVFDGVTAGASVGDFERRTGKRVAIWQHFVLWGGGFGYAIDDAKRIGARVMLHISTAVAQNEPERVSPGAIARGAGDDYLLRLGRGLAALGQPSYLRFLGEMNNCHNAYAAYNCSGSRRNADHSPRRLKQAWRRAYLILHGGPVATVDAALHKLGMPPVRTARTELPLAQVAFVWAPMTGGSPEIHALRPAVYWPGGRWVDWVGTSFYSRFPRFAQLQTFYRDWAVKRRKPFAIGEWAMWGADDASFPRRLFGWIRRSRRVRMVQYNQGDNPRGPFRLYRYPSATRVIRSALASPRFLGR